MKEIHRILDRLEQEESSLVFLGGIHGVGKTTLCNKYFKQFGFHCVTASSLIKKYGISIGKNKRVKDVGNNQNALIKQLNIEKSNYKTIVLDGHFCVINRDHQIETIEVSVFADINPIIIVLLKDQPKKIIKRLGDRDQRIWNKKFVKEFQRCEEQRARSISHDINTPLYIVDMGAL